jgi:hypothetical protein
MNERSNKINNRLVDLGRYVGLDEASSINARRNIKNIISMTIIAGFFIILGNLLMPGGPCGGFYGGGSIRDFKIIFGGLFY